MRYLGSIAFVLCTLGSAAAQQALPFEWIGGGHPDESSVAITPDGQSVISASFTDHTLKLWNLADGRCQRTFAAHFGGIHGLAVSPDGTRMVSGGEVVFGSSQSNVLVWDVATATIVMQLNGSINEVFAVAWSPDGASIAAGDQSGRMFVWNAATGALQHTIEGPVGTSIFAIAYSPDSATLAAGFNDNRARTYSIATHALQRTFTGHTFFVDAVAFSPNGQALATGSWDNTARLWNVATGASIATINAHENLVRAVRFANDGASFFTGSWDGKARRWSVPEGNLLRTYPAPGAVSVDSLALSPDGTVLLTGAIGGPMIAWNAALGTLQKSIGNETATIIDVDISADRSVIASATPALTATLWDASGSTRRALVGHTDVINAIAVSADGALAATGSGQPPPLTLDPSVRIWNTANGAQLRILPGHSGGTTAVDFAPDGVTVVSGGRDDAAKVWNAQTGALMRTIGGNLGSVGALAVSPDGTRVAVTSGTTRIWRLSDGALLQILTPPGANHPSSVDWSPDGTMVVVGEDAYGNNVRVWNAQTGALVRTFTGDENGFVQSVAFAPDGLSVACGSGYSEQIRRFYVADGSLLAVFDRETGWGPFPNLPMAYAPDGHLVYGRSDPTVVLAKCPGQVDTYGVGCAGTGGAVPALGATGCATTGSLLTIRADQGLGGAPAILLFGAGQAALPLLGCTLLVAPVLPVTLPIALSGSGAGTGGFDLPLLLGPGFPAIAFTTQMWVLDAAGPGGLSASNGLFLSIQ